MPPVGFVFLTLMFGVIIPSPTQGKLKMTVREAMNLSRSALEKRQSGDSNEVDAFQAFKRCLESLGFGGGQNCGEVYQKARMEEASKKYKLARDIPLKVWLQIGVLRCGHGLECYEVWGTCCPDNFAEKIKTQGGSSDECRIAKYTREKYKCENEYAAFQRFSPGVTNATPRRKSVWWTTVLAHTAYAISRRHLFSPYTT